MKIKGKSKTLIEIFGGIFPFIIFVIVQIIFHYLKIGITAKFSNYELFFQPIVIGIQVAIGLLGLVTMFYLGKMHDYKREFLKHEVEVVFESQKAKSSLKSLDAKAYANLTEMLNVVSDALTSIREMYFRLPSKFIILILNIVSIYAYSAFILLYFRETTNSSGILGSILSLLIGIGVFIRLWMLLEDFISLFDVGLKRVLAHLVFLKHVNADREYFQDYLNTHLQFIANMHKEEKSEDP